MIWKNKLAQLIGSEYPIIQAPMFGVTTPEMVAAASNIGCLGSLPMADLSAEDCTALIRKTRQLTNKAFAVNIFTHAIPELTDELKTKYSQTKTFIEILAHKNNLDVTIPNIEDLGIYSYHNQIDAIIEEECKILSFTFGNLDEQSIEKLKSNGTLLIGTCTSLNEAIILEKSGIDIICVQGWEAGGHRGSFQTDQIPIIEGLALLTKVSQTVDLPIIYAGGIYNSKTLMAAKNLGASGYQIGSLLLSSAESALKGFEKERLKKIQKNEIVLTNSFSGRYARGIKNIFIEEMEASGLILPFPYQNKLTSELRKVSKINQNTEFTNLWVGQCDYPFSDASTADILKSLIDQVE